MLYLRQLVAALFAAVRARRYLVLENLALRHQLAVYTRGRRSLTRFSGQFTCRHHAAPAAAAGLLSYSTGLRSPIEV